MGWIRGEWTAVLHDRLRARRAVESMMATVVPQAGRVLVVENGVYGERIAQICAQYRIAHERIVGRLAAGPDLAGIADALDARLRWRRALHAPRGRSSRDHHRPAE